MTRIVAGAARGRRLAVPPSARPTTDRVRESLFNVLTTRLDFDGLRVLDLYAGSGALGLEALSRGADSVLLVDSDRRAAEVIARNITVVGLPGATVRRGQVNTILSAGASAPMNLVLADPPYQVTDEQVNEVLASLRRYGWASAGTVVVVERPTAGAELAWPCGWEVWPARRYGDTRLEAAEFVGDDPIEAG